MKSQLPLRRIPIATVLLCVTSVTYAEEWSGHINGYFALKTLSSSDWPGDTDKHYSLGLLMDINPNAWPFSIALDFFDTGGKNKHNGMEDLGHTTELHIGARKFFTLQKQPNIQPYVGGGIAGVYAEQELEEDNVTTKEDDGAAGVWLGAGMYYEVNPKFVLGVDIRYSNAEVTIFSEKIDAGGFHTGVTLGYQF